MIIVSNNLIDKIVLPRDVIIRVNLSWILNPDIASKILFDIKNDIYLDYPSGRTKPPKPKITLEEAIELAREFKPRFFAVSNAEDIEELLKIKEQLPLETAFVPKIETPIGVSMFPKIIDELNIKYAMLDKDDLYLNSQGEPELYQRMLSNVSAAAEVKGVKLFELSGVVFS